jgi:uncharacterized protein
MVRRDDPNHLDVAAFAKSAAHIEAREAVQEFPRLALEVVGPCATPVSWSADGDFRGGAGGGTTWLHVRARAELPMQCQKCLEPMLAAVAVDRWFRFAADDASAAREDEDSEEDVLALDERFDLRGLVEDELLMELPMVPRHDRCAMVPTGATGMDGLELPVHPFAGLAALKH